MSSKASFMFSHAANNWSRTADPAIAKCLPQLRKLRAKIATESKRKDAATVATSGPNTAGTMSDDERSQPLMQSATKSGPNTAGTMSNDGRSQPLMQ